MVITKRWAVISAMVIMLGILSLNMFTRKGATQDEVSQKLSEIASDQKRILDALSSIQSDVDSIQHNLSIVKERER